MRFDFGTLNDYDGAGGYTAPGTPTIEAVSYATFSFFNFSNGDTIEFVAHYENGTTQSFVLTNGSQSSLTITAPAGTNIAWIDVYESNGSIKLNLDQVGVITQSIDDTIPVTMTFTDGDGDTVSGSTTIHVTDGATATTPNAVIQTSQTFQTQSFASSTLVSTNDNHQERGSTGNGNAMAGALAAVGLAVSHSVAAQGTADHVQQAAQPTDSHASAMGWQVSAAAEAGDAPAHGETLLPGGAAEHAHQPAAGLRAAANELHGHAAENARDAGHQAEPLHGAAEASTHESGAGASHIVAAAAVAMPSAEQLVALATTAHGANASVAGESAQHNQVVGKVLADALHGGEGHGANIDALINGLPGHSGAAPDALQVLASHADAAVSFGHMGFGGAFGGGHEMLSMEMAMHAAAPAHG
jgi:hypothetical protein